MKKQIDWRRFFALIVPEEMKTHFDDTREVIVREVKYFKELGNLLKLVQLPNLSISLSLSER